MSAIEDLLKAYVRFVRLPWSRSLAGAQRVWFAVYEPTQERRLRLRVSEFEVATKAAGHSWRGVDLTNWFGEWMAQHDYRDSYFEDPDLLAYEMKDFADSAILRLRGALSAPDVDDNTVVALLGVGSLFGLMKVSSLIEGAAPDIKGRLLVFYPGQHEATSEGSNYRLLDARDGWNYLAVPIKAADER